MPKCSNKEKSILGLSSLKTRTLQISFRWKSVKSSLSNIRELFRDYHHHHHHHHALNVCWILPRVLDGPLAYCSFKCHYIPFIIIINPVLIRFYPHKRGWPDLPPSASNLSHSHSPSCSILCILLLETNTLTGKQIKNLISNIK